MASRPLDFSSRSSLWTAAIAECRVAGKLPLGDSAIEVNLGRWSPIGASGNRVLPSVALRLVGLSKSSILVPGAMLAAAELAVRRRQTIVDTMLHRLQGLQVDE